MKFNESTINPQNEEEFDVLFDTYLRPLKSWNARRIFQVLAEEEATGVLTTLDIQARLDEKVINLSKKEINGWLHSLNDSGLAEKGEKRGKPTTIEYDDKYTFDLWRLTDLGEKISRGIPRILRDRPSLLEQNTEKYLETISKMDGEKRTQTLQRLEELNMLARILKKLRVEGCEVEAIDIMMSLRPTQIELKRILSKYVNPRLEVKLFSLRSRQKGFITRVLKILGLSSENNSEYALTEDGERLANALWPGEDFGH